MLYPSHLMIRNDADVGLFNPAFLPQPAPKPRSPFIKCIAVSEPGCQIWHPGTVVECSDQTKQRQHGGDFVQDQER